MIYFAYGSNMHPERLRRRVPSRRVLCVAALRGYALTFSKRGRDGSGKCAILPAQPTATVHGVLYRMSPSDRATLDAAEDTHGGGYAAVDVEVHVSGAQPMAAFTYVPPSAWIDPQLRPFCWYREFVLEGARHHGLPADYLASLARTDPMPDPDPARRTLNEGILAALRRGSAGLAP